MGKRGPQPGTKYQKRAVVAPPVPIQSDRALIEAQRLNDRLEAVLTYIDRNPLLLDTLPPRIASRFREYTEAVQDALIGGIVKYETREIRGRAKVPL